MSSSRPDYWQIQEPDKPLYPNLLWSKPENKAHAGKLLIVGGNLHGFNAPAKAYEYGLKAGAGSIRTCLPDKLEPSLKQLILEAEFLPSTLSGSFSRSSLAEILDSASWSDLVMLAGDFGKNSETAIMLESFLSKYKGPLSLTGDAIDYFIDNPKSILSRPNTLIVLSPQQLQKLTIKANPESVYKMSMSLMQVVSCIYDLSSKYQASIVTLHDKNILLSNSGKVASTAYTGEWSTAICSYCSVWQMQNPDKPFEALSVGIHEFVSQQL